MRIGIDVTLVTANRAGGIETYALELLRRLPLIAPEIEFVAFGASALRDKVGAQAANLRWIITPNDTERTLPFIVQRTWLPDVTRAVRLDLIHHVANLSCPPSGAPAIVTLHDLIPAYICLHGLFETWLGALRALRAAALMADAARQAAHVITVSQAAADQLTAFVPFPLSQISVIPLAAKFPPSPVPSDEQPTGDGPLVAVSAVAPHKNLLRLCRGYLRSGVRRPLWIAYGGRGPSPRLFQQLEELADSGHGRIRLLGHLDEVGLAQLYRSARAFITASLLEGFGLPPLEAASLGVPVAASSIAAHREVLGDAACYFDPLDENAIGDVLRRLDSDEVLCRRLAARGLLLASRYDWNLTASRTIEAYRRVIGVTCSVEAACASD